MIRRCKGPSLRLTPKETTVGKADQQRHGGREVFPSGEEALTL
jgi:hypothetical protein